MISCWSTSACMYFWEAAPAANRASFLACASSLRSSASGPSSSSPRRGPGQHFVHQLLDRGHQRQLSGHGALEQPAGDDQPVDLVGAFEDAVDARVAVGALRGILLDVAVAAVDLHGVVHHHSRASPSPTPSGSSTRPRTLRCASGSRGDASAAACVDVGERRVDHADGAVGQRLADVDARGTCRRASPASGRSRRSTCRTPCAPSRTRCAFCERLSRAAHARRAQLEAADVEDVERDVVALADLAEQVLDRAPGSRRGSAGRWTSRGCPSCALRRRRRSPGVLRSTMNAVNFSPSTLANTVNTSAKPALVIHIFSPLRT